MKVEECEGMLFSLLHHVHDFVRDIEMQELVGRTRFDLLLSLLAVRRLEELNWVIDSSLSLYYYDYRTGRVRGVPPYWRLGKVSKVEPY